LPDDAHITAAASAAGLSHQLVFHQRARARRRIRRKTTNIAQTRPLRFLPIDPSGPGAIAIEATFNNSQFLEYPKQ